MKPYRPCGLDDMPRLSISSSCQLTMTICDVTAFPAATGSGWIVKPSSAVPTAMPVPLLNPSGPFIAEGGQPDPRTGTWANVIHGLAFAPCNLRARPGEQLDPCRSMSTAARRAKMMAAGRRPELDAPRDCGILAVPPRDRGLRGSLRQVDARPGHRVQARQAGLIETVDERLEVRQLLRRRLRRIEQGRVHADAQAAAERSSKIVTKRHDIPQGR
jgi:hypothetical protein